MVPSFDIHGFEPFWEFIFHYFISEAEGLQRLYIGPDRDVVRMESVCSFRPGRENDYCVRLDSRYRLSGHVTVIHRSIYSDLLYYPSPVIGHVCVTELFYLCLYGEVGQAGVRLELLLYPDHVLVGQPHCAMMVRAPTPRHRTEVAICASGNFWLRA